MRQYSQQCKKVAMSPHLSPKAGCKSVSFWGVRYQSAIILYACFFNPCIGHSGLQIIPFNGINIGGGGNNDLSALLALRPEIV